MNFTPYCCQYVWQPRLLNNQCASDVVLFADFVRLLIPESVSLLAQVELTLAVVEHTSDTRWGVTLSVQLHKYVTQHSTPDCNASVA